MPVTLLHSLEFHRSRVPDVDMQYNDRVPDLSSDPSPDPSSDPSHDLFKTPRKGEAGAIRLVLGLP